MPLLLNINIRRRVDEVRVRWTRIGKKNQFGGVFVCGVADAGWCGVLEEYVQTGPIFQIKDDDQLWWFFLEYCRNKRFLLRIPNYFMSYTLYHYVH